MMWRQLWLDAKRDPTRALLVLLAVSLPFDHTPSVQFHGLSVRASAVIGGVLVLIALSRILREKRLPKLPWQGWTMLAWLIWTCGGVFWATDRHAAIKIVIPLTTLTLIGLACSVLWKKSYLPAAIKGLLFGAVLSSIFGFYQFIGNYIGLPNDVTAIRTEYSWQRFGFPRMESTMLEPLYFSAYLLLPIGLLSILILTSKAYRRWYWYGALALFLVADILTLSRGGLAALVVMFLVLFAQYWQTGFLQRHGRRIAIGAAAIIVLFIGALGIVNLTARQAQDTDLSYNKTGAGTFVSHLENFHFSPNSRSKALDDSVAQRSTARQEALHILGHDHRVLLIGTGPGQFGSYENTNHISGYSTPNNVILDQLIQSGVIGLLLLLSWIAGLLWGLLRQTWTTRRNLSEVQFLSKLSVAYLLGLALQAQTFAGLALTHLWFVVGLALFLIQFSPDQTKHKQHEHSPQKKAARRTRPNS